MSSPHDPRFSLATVRPLIGMARVDGRSLIAVFRCPDTAKSEKVVWRSPPVGVSAVTAQLKATSSLYTVRTEVNGLVRGLLGFGTLGRLARKVTDTTLAGGHPDAQLDAAEEEAALVAAFRSVASRFRWDGQRWTHTGDSAEGLTARLQTGPTLTGYDRDVVARMVVAVAKAHGGVSDEERSHLLDIFDEDPGSVDRLVARPPLTSAELAETTRGQARRSMLAATWGMALCDEHFDPEEAALLEHFANGLGIELEERIRLQTEAQVFVLEQFMERMFGWGSHDDTSRIQLRALAARIGASDGLVARTEARFQKKRLG